MSSSRAIRFRAEKSKLWPFLFFTLPIYGDTPTFAALCWLWAAITPVRKVAGTKSTTFSESSGQEMDWRWSLKLWVLALSENLAAHNTVFRHFLREKNPSQLNCPLLTPCVIQMLNCKVNSTIWGTFCKSSASLFLMFLLVQGALVMSK